MKPFTVKVHTVMESSHIPVHIGAQAIHKFCSRKIRHQQQPIALDLGRNSQIHVVLLASRSRAMKNMHIEPMGGVGITVEADETYIGRKSTAGPRSDPASSRPCLHWSNVMAPCAL